MRTRVSDILECTDFAGMASTAPPRTNNGYTSTAPSLYTPTVSSSSSPSLSSPRPSILHLGDEIIYNPEVYNRLESHFNIIRPAPADLERSAFIRHLGEGTWGDFSAIMKPFWSTGGQMHPWDKELINLLPPSMEVMAGAGAGFDWVDVKALAKRGEYGQTIECHGLCRILTIPR